MQDIDGGRRSSDCHHTSITHKQTPEADRAEYLNPLYQKQLYVRESERVVNQIPNPASSRNFKSKHNKTPLDLCGKETQTDRAPAPQRQNKREEELDSNLCDLHGGRGCHHRRPWGARGAPETLGELRCPVMVAAAVVVSSRAPPEALMKALTILHPGSLLTLCTSPAKGSKTSHYWQNRLLFAPSLYIVGTKALKEVCKPFCLYVT